MTLRDWTYLRDGRHWKVSAYWGGQGMGVSVEEATFHRELRERDVESSATPNARQSSRDRLLRLLDL